MVMTVVRMLMVVTVGYTSWKCFADFKMGRSPINSVINGGVGIGLIMVLGVIVQFVTSAFSDYAEQSDTVDSSTPSPTPEPTTEAPVPDRSGSAVDYGSIGLVVLIIAGVVALCVALGFLLRAALRGVIWMTGWESFLPSTLRRSRIPVLP